jgi:hypothetical protein
MDGNIKTIKQGDKLPTLKQPGYGEDWYWLIIKETRNRYKVPEESK